MDKILLINKPKGITSFDVVRKCKRILHEKKIGHTGTLDPNAEGFLIVLTGKYTKLLPYVIKDHKQYHAHFSLGKKYDTQDVWGTLVEERPYNTHTLEELDNASKQFLGDSLQVPPMYSAVKVNGKKLYEYAREGIEVERQARKITVNSLQVQQIAENDYTLDAIVSSGTYIRTLIEDYCDSINEIGTMTSLVRSGIESFSLKDAIDLEDLQESTIGISPLAIIQPDWKRVDGSCLEKQIKDGKKVTLQEDSDKVLFVLNDLPLAAYEREEGQVYKCVRGLF